MLATGGDVNSATNFLSERLNIRPHFVNDGFDLGAFVERNTNTAANKAGNVLSLEK